MSALAEDAYFDSGETISYQEKTYKAYPLTKSSNDMFGSEIPNDSIMFVYREAGTYNVIFLDKGVTKNNYTSAKTGSHIAYKDTDIENTNDKLQEPSSLTTISIAPRAPPSEIESGTSSCKIEGGLGWIICPITRTLASGMDFIYSMIMQYLEVAPLSTTNDTALYRAWGQVRNIANVLFIIGILVLIYSQVTGAVMTNYTIKKMLPRVVIAAVMVNLSYWICALAVDLSNVIGFSIGNLFEIVRNSLVGQESNNWNLVTWDSMATFILTGGTVVTGAGLTYLVSTTAITTAIAGNGLIFLFLPMLITVFFVVLITFLILAARQAIIVILIVLAPIAFVAYLLPNTEEWFDKWRKGLTILLILFPAFSVVFYGAQLASAIIIQNANGANGINMVLLAMGVQLAPLAITPLLLKLGGGVLNRFANIVNNPAKGVFDRGKNWANERRDQSLSRGSAVLASRANRGLLDPTRRFNPSSMAYRRNNDRLTREGEKAANESLNTAYFTQTANGRRIAMMNQRAKLEQGLGDNRNQEQWNNNVRTNPLLNNRAHQSHEAHKRADLYQRAVDTQGDEHWAHTQQHDPGLLAIRRNAHLSEGRAKLTEESISNADERALQTQISQTAGLRGLKVRADVDAAHANLQSANVTAQGKAVFQNEVVASAALRTLNSNTVSFEKEASSIENRLKSDAEARWEQNSRTDVRLQGIRLSEVKASEQHKQAEAQWNNLVENIRLNGGSNVTGLRGANRGLGADIRQFTKDVAAEEMTTKALQSVISSRNEEQFIKSSTGRDLNIRNLIAKDSVDAAKAAEAALGEEWRTEKGAEKLLGNDAKLAKQLREADTNKRVQAQRLTNAQGVASSEYATQISESQALAKVAGGIDDYGAKRAQATAVQTLVEGFGKNVSSEKTTMSKLNDAELYDIATDTSLSSERRAAAAGKIMSGGAMRSIHKLMRKMKEPQPTGSKERDAVRDIQMQMKDDMNRAPFGLGDTDKSALGRGELGQEIPAKDKDGNIVTDSAGNPIIQSLDERSLEELFAIRAQNKMSGDAWIGMDPDDRSLLLELAQTEEGRNMLGDEGRKNLLEAFREINNTPEMRGRLKTDGKRAANAIALQFGEQEIFTSSNDSE